MIRKELSLIINSILIPLAAGLYILPAVYLVIITGSKIQIQEINFSYTSMTIAGPITLLGIIISLFHLGNPFRAYRSIRKIDTSWLSREVFFTGSFFMLWLVYYLMAAAGMTTSTVIWLTVICAVLSIISMANIYHSTGKPGWSGFNTYTGFIGSIIILGSTGTTAVAVCSGADITQVSPLLISSLIPALIILSVRFIHHLIHFKKIKPGDSEWSLDRLVSGSSPDNEIISRYKTFIISGAVLSFSGLCSSVYFIQNIEVLSNIIFTAPVVMVLAGEFLERCGFYILGPE